MGLLIGAVGFVVFFYCLPFDTISDALKNVMGIATRYTMGIYCMHILVGKILVTVVEKLGFAINSFFVVRSDLCDILRLHPGCADQWEAQRSADASDGILLAP